jgi:hypothetical protein
MLSAAASFTWPAKAHLNELRRVLQIPASLADLEPGVSTVTFQSSPSTATDRNAAP